MTPTSRLRWGILGTAKITERLIPAFRQATRAELGAIASRDAERARAFAQAAGVARAHTGYEAMLADPDIDAVYIPLPNTLHDQWARHAADAGKHVLCEKPLTPTAPEARELVDYCQARGVVLVEGFMWPHHPRTKAIREVIDKGTIGQVTRVGAAFTFKLPLEPTNIRLQPDLAGGCLLDVGCYPVYGIRWAFGAEPVRAYAAAQYDFEVDVAMSGIVWLADGRMGTFDCGFTTPQRQWLEITGSEGVVRVEDMWLPDAEARFTLLRDGAEPEVVRVGGHDQIACMIDAVARAALDKEPVYPDPEEAIKTLAVLDALARSAAEEREMDV